MARRTGHPVYEIDGETLIADFTRSYTGNESGATPGVPVLPGGVSGVPVTSIEAAGDSWPAGFGSATPGTFGYVARLAKLLHTTATNLGLSGGAATGTAAQGGTARVLQSAAISPTLTAGPYFARGGLKLIQTGYNDGTLLGMGGGATAVVENCLTALVAAMRPARHIAYNDAAVTRTGGGVAGDATLVLGTGYVFLSANGDRVDIALDAAYNGEPITLLHPHYAGFVTTGVLTFALDPAGANTPLGAYDGPAFDAALKAPATDRDATCCFRIPGGVIPPGAHVIRMTASGISGGNYATFGGAIVEGRAPTLLPLYAPAAATDPVQIAWANARMTAVAALFDAAEAVDLTAALSEVRMFADGIHPNNLGNARVAGTILAALDRVLTAELCGEMN